MTEIKFDSQNQKLIQETLHNNWEQFEKEFKNQAKYHMINFQRFKIKSPNINNILK